MAVDTENKRRSVIGILPVPDGTIKSPDFQQVAGLYAGINTVVSKSPDSRVYLVALDDRSYLVPGDDQRIYNVSTEDRVLEVQQ